MRLALVFLYLIKGVLRETLQQLFTPIAFAIVAFGAKLAFPSFQVQLL